jgi:hypothetical protein
MERLRARGRALAEQRAMEVRKQIAGRMPDTLSGVRAHVEGDGIMLSGRGLRARIMREPVLRWIGSVLR